MGWALLFVLIFITPAPFCLSSKHIYYYKYNNKKKGPFFAFAKFCLLKNLPS
jgi:hypothetical protein